MTRKNGGVPGVTKATTTYGYDPAGRLTGLTHTNSQAQPLEDFQYEYTLDNEIAAITSLYSAPSLPNTQTVGTADAANRVAQFGSASLTLDNEGQTTQKGTNNYQWDARGRLTQVTLPSNHTVSYGYDALGRRVSRSETANNVTTVTTFLYDGADVVLDQIGASDTVDYLNGPGIDEKLRQQSTISGMHYFLSDHLGSTAALVDGTGGSPGSAVRLQYEAFGAGSGTAITRFDYTGRERDAATGLMYYRARWSDPQQGRFLSEDPIGIEGGLNLYAYVENNPVSLWDPYGLDPFKLPANPGTNGSNLPGWTRDPIHGHPQPGSERWISPDGKQALDFHPGRPGMPGDQDKDHWHRYDPNPKKPGKWAKDKDKYFPGDKIPDPGSCPTPAPTPSQNPAPERRIRTIYPRFPLPGTEDEPLPFAPFFHIYPAQPGIPLSVPQFPWVLLRPIFAW